jgi:hypothetical protein
LLKNVNSDREERNEAMCMTKYDEDRCVENIVDGRRKKEE